MLWSPQQQPRSTVRRWVMRIVCYTGPVGVVATLFTLQHRPSWYRPVHLTDVEARDARADATRMVDEMGDKLDAGVPFEMVLHEQNVNAWLTATPQAWQELFRSSEIDVADPAVAFVDGHVIIGALFHWGPWPLILATTWRPDVSPDRESIDLRLVNVRGGSLPIPTGVLASVAEALHSYVGSSTNGGAQSVTQTVVEHATPITAFIDGIPISNLFVWPNGERAFRINAIEVGNGQLRIEIDPV